jgi:hypothetical protein
MAWALAEIKAPDVVAVSAPNICTERTDIPSIHGIKAKLQTLVHRNWFGGCRTGFGHS